jgi:hypothetical protein
MDSTITSLSREGISGTLSRWLSNFYDDDPKKNWEHALQSIFIIGGSFEDVADGVSNASANRKSMVYFIFTILQVVRFIILIVLNHDDTDSEYLYMFGSIYYPLGEGGRVTYIALAFAMTEMVIFRWTFMTSHKKGRLTFMKDMVSDQILHGRFKEKFDKLFQKAYILFRSGTSVILYFGILDSMIMGVVCASKETNPLGMGLWIFWCLVQCMVIKAFTNMIFVTGFWYSSVLHLKIQLDQLRHQLRLTQESSDKYLTNFHFIHIRNHYKNISDKIQEYNKTSRYLILGFNYCSAPTNCALFYAAMKTESFFSLFFIVVGCVTVSQSVFLLSTATLINDQSKKMFSVLNSVFVDKKHLLSLMKRKQLKRMIEDSSSDSTPVTLRTFEGAAIKPENFLAYVLSSFTLFILLVDFSHQFLETPALQ